MGEPLDPPANATYTLTAGHPTPPGDDDEDLGLPRGTSVGRYVVLDKLGSGGMGVVLAAYDPELDRKVALKLLRARATESTSASQGQARLLREAQAMARLSHPNVVPVHDVGTIGDRVFIAMELVEGTTAKDWLDGRPRSWREVLGVFIGAGRGLAAAHASGIIHRDFKPSNVLIGKDGRVRVMDFGVARAVGSSSDTPTEPILGEPGATAPTLDAPLTRVGMVVGTPGYMAPEQIEGRTADARTDQFGFCIALYEALYGRRPVAGESKRPQRARVPRWVHQVLVRGLRQNPNDRYPTLEALLEELAADPAIRRRRWLVATAAVAVAALGALGYHYAAERQSLLCKGAERKLAGVWDAEQKLAAAQAFQATRKPYATDAWSRVERLLDDYARQWVTMHTDACEATRVRGEQSEAVLSLRMVCLQQRRDELGALTRLFAQADSPVAEKAVQAAHALTALKQCADVAALMAPLEAPTDEAARANMEAVRSQLARAKVLLDAGKYPQGVATAAEAATAAKQVRYRPLEAEALYLLGNLQNSDGSPKQAESTWKEAVWAAEAGHDDRLKTRALAMLVFVVGYTQSRFDEAELWNRQARSVIERLGGYAEGEELLAMYYGAMLRAQGKYDDAVLYRERALGMMEKRLGPDHPEVARILNNLANSLVSQGNHEKALPLYQRSLAIWEKSIGTNHPLVVLPYQNLANLLAGLGRYREALQYSERAIALAESTLGPTHLWVGHCHVSAGRALLGPNEFESALAHFRRAKSIFEQALGPNDQNVAIAQGGIGSSLRGLRRAREALASYDQALVLFQKAARLEHSDAAPALTGKAEILMATQSPRAGLVWLERALRALGPHPDDRMVLAHTQFSLARALWESQGNGARARALAEQAQAAYAQAREDNEARLAEVAAWRAQHP